MIGVPTPDVTALADARARARAERDFTAADALRDELSAAGWAVIDEPGGTWRLVPVPDEAETGEGPLAPHDVPSVLADPATDDVSAHWVSEGWPDDVARAIASFRAHEGDRRVRYVVADVTGADPTTFGPDVEVVSLVEGTGWAAAANAGLRRATGRIVLVMDGSIEASGDVFGPLERSLADVEVGIAGPFGIVTHDLRQFDEAPGPGPCDAIEGYCMAMRRDLLAAVEGFDEKFRWYRTADIELSFRVKDRGLRTEVVGLPLVRHEHRMWFETDPADRAKWSKRNFYRFLDRWRDRWDLVLDPRPPERP
ncbi:MAG: glycosyltransferase [Actinomycetota bacterium]|nr:glycosyltransferase [Actinomycetota bacterium]MDH5313042.1 glycosyltransferase [Actinomycetota bacterium]